MFFFGPDMEPQPSPPPKLDIDIRPAVTYRPSSPDLPSAPNSIRKHGRESAASLGPNEVTPQPSQKRSRKAPNSANAERTNNLLVRPSTPAAVTNTDAGSAMEVDQLNGHELPAAMAGGPVPLPREAAFEEAHGAEANGAKMGMGIRMEVDGDPATAAPAAAAVAVAGIGGAVEPPEQEPVVEPVPIVLSTLANGDNAGVQVDPAKVANLGPTTTLLQVPEAQQVTHLAFSPSDSSLLTASGVQFCGSWRTFAGTSGTSTQTPEYRSFIGTTEETMVTALTWEPSGSILAVATYDNQSGRIHLIDGQELSLIETLPASQRAITSLKWLPSGPYLLGVAAFDEPVATTNTAGSSLLLWDLTGFQNISAPSFVTIPDTILDVDSTLHAGQNVICIAGDAAVYQCRATPGLQVDIRWPAPMSWTFVRCTSSGNHRNVVVATSADSMTIWIPSHDIMRREVHAAPITGLEFRPVQQVYTESRAIHEFATSSMDGTIRIWRLDENFNSLGCVAKVVLEVVSPIMALSYSPDGFCIAGASYDKVQIWNADSNILPLAAWNGSDNGWRGASIKEDDALSNGAVSSVNGDHTSTSDHCLSWDVSSKKLAFSLGSQVS